MLLSLDGALGGVAFAALPGRTAGSFLLEEYTLAAIPAPRQVPALLAQTKTDKRDPSMLVVGDVDFDRPLHLVASLGSRSGPGADLRSWTSLPGTAREMEEIARHFQARFPGSSPTLLHRGEASKPAVRAALAKHRWVHLATHGYFANESIPSALDRKPGEESDLFGRRGVSGWHPLLLSGIVLAGANREAKPGEEDGILTALEVRDMDLRGCELAVLSACETGLGRTAGGQGVLGLQRAFAMAGARTTVTSLWQVPDAATQALMQRFYENLWGGKMSKVEALRQAQLWLLREGAKRPELLRGVINPVTGTGAKRPPVGDRSGKMHPFWWAAWVLSGDVR